MSAAVLVAATVDLHGRPDAVDTLWLRNVLGIRIARGDAVTVDVSDVVEMDLALLSALVVSAARARRSGVGFRVRGPFSPAVQQLLDDTRMGPVLGIEEAVR